MVQRKYVCFVWLLVLTSHLRRPLFEFWRKKNKAACNYYTWAKVLTCSPNWANYLISCSQLN